MKKHYTTFIIGLITLISSAQSYEFGIVYISNYDFKIVATPNFTSSGNTDVSDIGFTLMLPAGATNVLNETGLLGGRTWTVQEVEAATLVGNGGDGTKDAFLFNLAPGQTLFSHTSGDQLDLVSFEVSNTPTIGEVTLLLNSDPIATGFSGVFDSFYNVNLGAGTTDEFLGLTSGMDTIMFSSLGVEDEILNSDIKVYPNPAKSIINISSSLNITKIELYNLLGQKVVESTQTTQLDVSNLNKGLYFLNVYSKKGRGTKKIIVE